MNDASGRKAQHIGTARYGVARGDRSASIEAWSAAIETTRSDPSLAQEHATALTRLGTLKLELGQREEAEKLLTEAITFVERHLGADHRLLAVALNELSRLCVRQKDFARAEPMLRRLVQITRAKGDRHPDVATALAGLAVAKRGLGDDASAERLYRHALRIREEVLAPDHMAIVITLEQLSETCAARGSFAEALVHLQRAVLRRETALGAEHATVQALRARIADLHRRNTESMAREADPPPAPPTPAIAVATIAPPVVAETPAPAAPPARTSAEWRATPLRTRSVASMAPRASRPSELAYIHQPEPAATSVATPRRPEPTEAPAPAYRDTRSEQPAPAFGTVAAASDVQPAAATLPEHTAPRASTKRIAQYASIGAAVLVLGIAGFAFSSPARTDAERAPAASAEEAPSTVVRTASMTTSPATISASAGSVRPTAALVAMASGVDAGPLAPATQPAPASDDRPSAPSVHATLTSLRKLVVPKVATPNLDSVLQVSARLAHDADARGIGSEANFQPPASSDAGTVMPPVLIGSAPTPRFPDELRAHPIEGEVIVQFRVNEKGRVDPSSMQVLQSQHELFTAAVRNVLTQFRFEPAHLGAPGSKPQAAWVQFRTRFDARR